MGDVVQFKRFSDDDIFAAFEAESPDVDGSVDKEIHGAAKRALAGVPIAANPYRSTCVVVLFLALAGLLLAQNLGARNGSVPIDAEPDHSWRASLDSWQSYIESLEASAAHQHWVSEKKLFEAARAQLRFNPNVSAILAE